MKRSNRDIGSIFPLYEEHYKIAEEAEKHNPHNYALCREAMKCVAESMEEKGMCKTVMIPAYTCQTVIDPFVQLGWQIRYYSIDEDLRINTNDFLNVHESFKPALVVAHPYYGMDLNTQEIGLLQYSKRNGGHVMVDRTQCIFQEENHPNIVDYYVGSYRKWFPVPDGAYLESYEHKFSSAIYPEFDDFVQKQTQAMFLRGEYFISGNQQTKDKSIKLNKSAVKETNREIHHHKMSAYSESIMASEDLRYNEERRKENYKILFEGINDTDKIERVNKDLANLTTAPLYFPVYVKDRKSLQAHLAQQRIYCPILWGVETPEVLINDTVRYIYDHILVIPVDQRNGDEDMIKIVEAIKEWNV